MADVLYGDIYTEHDELTPATMAFCVQREDDPDATPQSVRCGQAHEGPAALTAALMRRPLASAAVYRVALSRGAGRHPSL